MVSNSVNAAESTSLARKAIQTGAVPKWVLPGSYDAGFKANVTAPITQLLIERQVHAEHRQTFYRTATRLETMEAVQHESQWRLQFEPRSQSVTLHWVKVRRGDQEFDHTNLERLRLLQREEGLERFVVDGWFTMVMLLEDVRVGDILDCCYTVENRSLFLDQYCWAFFALPQAISVAKHRFLLRLSQARKLRWQASSTEVKPTEHQENGVLSWEWVGEKS